MQNDVRNLIMVSFTALKVWRDPFPFPFLPTGLSSPLLPPHPLP